MATNVQLLLGLLFRWYLINVMNNTISTKSQFKEKFEQFRAVGRILNSLFKRIAMILLIIFTIFILEGFQLIHIYFFRVDEIQMPVARKEFKQ